MDSTDPFLTAYQHTAALLRQARPDQLHEALRLLGCEVAYCQRYHEVLPLPELIARINAASQDPASADLLNAGLAHLAEVLGRLRVAPPAG